MLSIFELRKLTGLSQGKFAKKYHIALNTLHNWEQGISKPPEHFVFAMNELLRYEGYIHKRPGE